MSRWQDDIAALRHLFEVTVVLPPDARIKAAAARIDTFRALTRRLPVDRLIDFTRRRIEALLPKLEPSRAEVDWARRTLPRLQAMPAIPPGDDDRRRMAELSSELTNAVEELWRALLSL